MLVGLTNLIEAYDSKLFSCIYGDNYRLFTMNTKTVDYSLRENERKRVHGLTNQLLVHIVMIKWSEDDRAIKKNIDDLLNKFIKPIYNVCKKNYVMINQAIAIDDTKLSTKKVKNSLINHHDHSGKFNEVTLYSILNELIYELEKLRLRNTNFDDENFRKLIIDCINKN